MSSILRKLLIDSDRPASPKSGSGRKIVFDKAQPDITLVTGSISERIEAFMLSIGEPCTVSEIAHGIGSNASRVSSSIKRLREMGKVEGVKVEGCVAEYVLKE